MNVEMKILLWDIINIPGRKMLNFVQRIIAFVSGGFLTIRQAQAHGFFQKRCCSRT
jgi:hypothetical protein